MHVFLHSALALIKMALACLCATSHVIAFCQQCRAVHLMLPGQGLPGQMPANQLPLRLVRCARFCPGPTPRGMSMATFLLQGHHLSGQAPLLAPVFEAAQPSQRGPVLDVLDPSPYYVGAVPHRCVVCSQSVWALRCSRCLLPCYVVTVPCGHSFLRL